MDVLPKELRSPILILKDCIVRSYHPSDAALSALKADSPAIARFMGDRFPQLYTSNVAKRWIEGCLKDNTTTNFAIADINTNKFLGAIGMKPQIDPHIAEIGYWLGETHWGKGIMSQAVEGFTSWIFTTRPQIVRVEASVLEGNIGSEIVLQRNGYLEDGTLSKLTLKGGRIVEIRTYALGRNDWKMTMKQSEL